MQADKRKEINKRVAAAMRGHRATHDLTQEELADGVEANPSTVSAWENRGGPSIADAWVAADFYGISIDELVGHKVPA